MSDIRNIKNTLPVFIAPDPDNVLYFAEVFEVDQNWIFPDLPTNLQEQLLKRLPIPMAMEEPA
eukprot:584955-Prorocentrum_lima.AAC.1